MISPAARAARRADVDHVVGCADRLLVVLDDDDAVAEIAQGLERLDQLLVVMLVEADRWFVEDVEHAGEPGADLRREADALCLTAGQRAGLAIEAEVAEADFVEEAEAFAKSR